MPIYKAPVADTMFLLTDVFGLHRYEDPIPSGECDVPTPIDILLANRRRRLPQRGAVHPCWEGGSWRKPFGIV